MGHSIYICNTLCFQCFWVIPLLFSRLPRPKKQHISFRTLEEVLTPTRGAALECRQVGRSHPSGPALLNRWCCAQWWFQHVSTYQGHGSRDVYLHFSSEFCSHSDLGAFSGVHPDWIAMNPVSTCCLGDIQWPLQHSFAAIDPLTDDASASPSPISQDRDVSWRET